MYAEGNKERHSRASKARPKRGGDAPQNGSQRKTPYTGWMLSPDSNPEACPNLDRRPSLHGKDVSNKVINRHVTQVAELGDMKALFETISSHLPAMNGINLATAIHRVAKLANGTGKGIANLQAVKTNPRFIPLMADICRHISGHRLLGRRNGHGPKSISHDPGEMPVQCLSIVAWSCATLRIHNTELFAWIAAIVEPNLSELKPFELSNLLWAYAKLHMPAPELFSTAAERLLNRRDGEYKVQCLSTMVWCFATMQLRNAAVFSSVAKELAAHASEAKPQEISTTLWAFAKNRHLKNAALFEVFGQTALAGGKMRQFKLQELSNTAWAFATTGLKNPELFKQIEHAVLSKLSEMESQSIANITWAFAKLQVPLQTRLFPVLLEMTVTTQEKFKPQELSAVIWAASRMCPENESFFGDITRICLQRLGQFSANAIANLVKTLSEVTTDSPSVFVAILQESLQRLPQLQPHGLCNALHGAAAAATAPTYAAWAEAIGDAAAQVCQYTATRTGDFKLTEIQLLSVILEGHRASIRPSTAQALERAMKEREGRNATSHDGEDHNDHSGHISDDEEHAWPTSLDHGSSYGDSGADSIRSRGSSRVSGDGVGALPEKVSLASALQETVAAAPLGNTLASLAKGTGGGAAQTNPHDFTHPNRIAQLPVEPANFQQFPQQGHDQMPMKVPVPSDWSCAPYSLPLDPAWGGCNFMPWNTNAAGGYNANPAEAMLMAQFSAMIAANISGAVAAGKNGQSVFPAPPPGLRSAAHTARHG